MSYSPITRHDRDQSYALNGLTQTPRRGFTGQPTRIVPPTNDSRPPMGSGGNPYNRLTGHSDNLNANRGSVRVGNPSRLTYLSSEPPPKRQKVMHEVRTPTFVSSSSRHTNPFRAADPITVDDSDNEDLGERLPGTGDGLATHTNLSDLSTSHNPLRSKASDTPSLLQRPSSTQRNRASTEWLSEKHQPTDAESISLFSDEEPSSEATPADRGSLPPKGNVKSKINSFERQPIDSNPLESATTYIDFRKEAQNPNRSKGQKASSNGGRIRSQMKGKSQGRVANTRIPLPFHPIDEASDASHASSAGPSRLAQPRPSLLCSLIIGYKRLDGPYEVSWSEAGGPHLVVAKSGASEHVARLKLHDMTSIMLSAKPLEKSESEALKLRTSVSFPKKSLVHLLPDMADWFEPGTSYQQGDILFYFDTPDPASFKNFHDFCPIHIQDREWTSTPNKPWEHALNSCQMKEQEMKRKAASRKRPASEVSDETDLPERLLDVKNAGGSRDGNGVSRATSSKSSQYDDEEGKDPPRRSSRIKVEERKRHSPPADPDEIIFDSRSLGRLMKSDLARLRPNEFLNDTLIEFGLRLWLQDLEDKSPGFTSKIHLFNSFFYEQLSKKNSDEGYQSVKRWTAKVNIFEKTFLIVPVNEHFHWFLAIIYLPEFTLRAARPPPQAVTKMTRRKAQELGGSDGPLDLDVLETAAAEASTHPRGPGDDDDTMQGVPSSDLQDMQEVDEQLTADQAIPALFKFDSAMTISVPDGDHTERESMEGETVEGTPERQSSPLTPATSDMDVDEEPAGVDSRNKILEEVPDSEPEQEPSRPNTSFGHHSSLSTGSDMDFISMPEGAAKPDAERSKAPPKQPGIPPEIFYGKQTKAKAVYGKSQKAKGKQKAVDLDEADTSVDVTMSQPPHDVPVDLEQTYVFTLDSLGSQHKKVINVLTDYLQREAQEKFSEKIEPGGPRKAIGKMANALTQPNFCDCGIYLLHFAGTFVSDPERYCKLIMQPRNRSKKALSVEENQNWDPEGVKNYREDLYQRIQLLSTAWKAEKEKEKKEKKEEPERLESSDDEIIVESANLASTANPSPPPPPPPPKRKGKQVRKSIESDRKAARLR